MPATRSVLVVALVAASATTTCAFAPPASQLRQQSGLFASGLEVVDENASEQDPFDAYQTTDAQTTIAIKDNKIGTGYTVGEEESQQLTVKYKATFLEPNPGKQFDKSEGFICKTGQNKILPGFEEGMKVCTGSVCSLRKCVARCCRHSFIHYRHLFEQLHCYYLSFISHIMFIFPIIYFDRQRKIINSFIHSS